MATGFTESTSMKLVVKVSIRVDVAKIVQEILAILWML